MATYNWNTTSGAFGTAANWTPSGPPGTADTAIFGTGTGTISGTGSVALLELDPTGTWTWSGGTVTAANFTVNDTVTLSNGAVWTLSGTPAQQQYMVIGSGNGGNGSLTVAGGASITSTQAANSTNYAIYVGSGGTSNAVGALTISGSGSSVNTGANGVAVGQAGTGTLTVQAGASATFTSGSLPDLAALAVGRSSGGSGTVVVTGTGATLTGNGLVYIGRGGTGALTVSSSGTLTGGLAASGSNVAYGIDVGDSTGTTATTQAFGGTGTAQVTTGGTLHSLAYLSVGINGSTGSLTVDGSGSRAQADSTITIGGGTTRTGGKGTLTVSNGATARAGTSTNSNAGISIGSGVGSTGTATVTGSNSLLDANGYRLSIGTTGTGLTSGTSAATLTVSNGGKVLSGSTGYTDTEAALAIAAATGTTGTLTITGTGSQLVASGTAVVGGNNNGSGVTKGGTATVSVASGGSLQTGAMTIQSGSTVTVDQASTLTTPSITLNGGSADLYTLANSTAVSFATSSILRVHAATGTNTVSGFTFGDEVDVAAGTSVSLSGNTLTVGSGTINLGTAPANSSYQLFSDGSGGMFAALTPKTVGVYRFFDSSYGTHFYTVDPNEAAMVAATRTDLTPEGPGGIGLQAVAVSASDPNATAVYRFFDTVFGTHFFTASATERDSIIASRTDLTYEAGSTFYEHATAQPGDTAVYRYFDNVHGTHFYTDSASEQANIAATRPDLISEGVGFYEPAQNYLTTSS